MQQDLSEQYCQVLCIPMDGTQLKELIDGTLWYNTMPKIKSGMVTGQFHEDFHIWQCKLLPNFVHTEVHTGHRYLSAINIDKHTVTAYATLTGVDDPSDSITYKLVSNC